MNEKLFYKEHPVYKIDAHFLNNTSNMGNRAKPTFPWEGTVSTYKIVRYTVDKASIQCKEGGDLVL